MDWSNTDEKKRRFVGCMLTLGRNYSSLVRSSPGPGRFLTPWRVPAIQRQREKLLSTSWRKMEEEDQQQQHTG